MRKSEIVAKTQFLCFETIVKIEERKQNINNEIYFWNKLNGRKMKTNKKDKYLRKSLMRISEP